MAGVGPPPKDPSKRARKNSEPIPLRVVSVDPVPQPELVDVLGEVNPATEEPWQPATLRLWKELGDFPSTDTLRAAQWSLLARVMILDDALVSGEVKHAAEARLQLAKFGIAPDDVARLRIVFAQADEADEKVARKRPASKRYKGLRLADGDALEA